MLRLFEKRKLKRCVKQSYELFDTAGCVESRSIVVLLLCICDKNEKRNANFVCICLQLIFHTGFTFDFKRFKQSISYVFVVQQYLYNKYLFSSLHIIR